VIETFVHAIGDRTVREEGGETAFAGLDQGFVPGDVQIGFLLAGETGIGKILRRCRAPDGHIGVFPVFFAKLPVGGDDGGAQVIGEGGVVDELPHLVTSGFEIFDVVGVQVRKNRFDLIDDPRGFEQIAVGVGGYRISVGNADPLGDQFPAHFSQGGVFPSHLRDIGELQFIEPDCQSVVAHGIPPVYRCLSRH